MRWHVTAKNVVQQVLYSDIDLKCSNGFYEPILLAY